MTESPLPIEVTQPVESPMLVGEEMLQLLIQKEQPYLQARQHEAEAFINHLDVANKVARDHSAVLRSKQVKIMEASTETSRNLNAINSSQTISEVYLKMLDDFGSNIDPIEFRTFFIECLNLNNQQTERFAKVSGQENARIAFLASKGKVPDQIVDIVKKIDEKTAPVWFRGNNIEWKNFFRACAAFPQYLRLGKPLHPENLPEWFRKKREEKGNPLKYLGNTYPDQYPDWLFEWRNELPDPNVVKKEIEEDENEREMVKEIFEGFQFREERVRVDHNSRLRKGISYFELWRRKLERSTSLIDFMIYLGATAGVYEYPGVDGSNSEGDNVYQKPLSPQESKKRAIGEYLDIHRFDRDVVALWLEGKMKDRDIHSVLNWFSQIRTQEELYTLKSKDKKLHDTIKYSFGPFFASLSSEEREYILELSGLDQSTSQILFDIAEIFSTHLQNGMLASYQKLENEIGQTANKWILRFEDPVFRQKIMAAVGSEYAKTSYRDNNTEQAMAEADQLSEEVEKEKKVLHDSSLISWNRYWIRDYNREGKSTAIEGETIEEIIDNLDVLFESNGEAYSIKTSSIVNALEWFIGVPEKIKALWMKEEIDGVSYYKIKRGAIRIFCTLNPENKSIHFFTYQKKGMSYSFRN